MAKAPGRDHGEARHEMFYINENGKPDDWKIHEADIAQPTSELEMKRCRAIAERNGVLAQWLKLQGLSE